VVGRTPGSGAAHIGRNVPIRVRFSEPVRGVSTTTVRLVNVRTGLVVSATVRYDPATRTATLTPRWRRLALTLYRVEVRAGIRDAAGNGVVATSWRFRTGIT
jgi:hypothetical protein